MFISVKEAGRRLRKSRWTVMALIKSGELEAVKGPTAKSHVHVVEESVARYIERHTMTPIGEGEK
jgi:excisionase family DNA binding protein